MRESNASSPQILVLIVSIQQYRPSPHQHLAKCRLQDKEGSMLGNLERHFRRFGGTFANQIHGLPGRHQAIVRLAQVDG
jgi:hypothetical protein